MAAADHLQVPRQHGLFNHHGIDLGDGTVAHYLEGRAILRSPVEEFSRGQPLSVVAYPNGDCSAAGITLRRAMSRLGEQNYNLLFNNCEHFAHWCKTGRHRSTQVEDWLHTGSLGALAFGQFVPAAVLSGARILLRQGLRLDDTQLKKGRELALRSLEQLDRLRQMLQEKLEAELAKATATAGGGGLGGGSGSAHSGLLSGGDDSPSRFEAIRLAAQTLADQLSEVEELEARIEQMLGRRQ